MPHRRERSYLDLVSHFHPYYIREGGEIYLKVHLDSVEPHFVDFPSMPTTVEEAESTSFPLGQLQSDEEYDHTDIIVTHRLAESQDENYILNLFPPRQMNHEEAEFLEKRKEKMQQNPEMPQLEIPLQQKQQDEKPLSLPCDEDSMREEELVNLCSGSFSNMETVNVGKEAVCSPSVQMPLHSNGVVNHLEVNEKEKENADLIELLKNKGKIDEVHIEKINDTQLNRVLESNFPDDLFTMDFSASELEQLDRIEDSVILKLQNDIFGSQIPLSGSENSPVPVSEASSVLPNVTSKDSVKRKINVDNNNIPMKIPRQDAPVLRGLLERRLTQKSGKYVAKKFPPKRHIRPHLLAQSPKPSTSSSYNYNDRIADLSDDDDFVKPKTQFRAQQLQAKKEKKKKMPFLEVHQKPPKKS